ncbi:MAG: FliA/WhiG family RNA polymerase sigma factor [Planctomycetes bacterium]|nr:FliA/WhiG family RNA polymerase sigma factor [Planctomycetota bacterium]
MSKPYPMSTKRTEPAAVSTTTRTARKGNMTTNKQQDTGAPKRTVTRPKLKRVADFDEVVTEDLWNYYRQAVEAGPKKAHEVEKIRNTLMERHYPLVKYIAERLQQTLPRSIELDDLISAGLFGLMDAIRGFDPDRGFKFKTYCSTRIRGSILDQLRSQDWVPRLVRLKATRIDKALQSLTSQYGREPTHSELAESLELSHGDLSKEISGGTAKAVFSISERWDDSSEDGGEKSEIIEDKKATDPISELHQKDLMVYLTRSLTSKERFIIEQYYQVGHTMREIGEMLALTESRVCQIHSNVMGRLKGLLGQKEGTLLM